jgi:hypothetical protein
MDMRGYGDSDKPLEKSSYVMKNFISDIKELISALGQFREKVAQNKFIGPQTGQNDFQSTPFLFCVLDQVVPRLTCSWDMTGAVPSPGHSLQRTLKWWTDWWS